MLKNNALSSGILMVSASWIAKFLGLISTIILARLLTPVDFGLVSIAMLILYFFDVFSQTGTQQYLLSLDDVTKEDLDTAWTLNFIAKIIVAVILVLISGFAADLFKEDLQASIIVCASIPIIMGLESPAINIAKREFNYRRIFFIQLAAKFIGFLFTIGIAFVTRSHWAMIIGSIMFYAVLTVGSYFIHTYKPRFSLTNFHAQWAYSKWIFFKGVIGYMRAKGDSFILAKLYTTHDVGVFTIAKEFAMLIYDQIAMPLSTIIMTSTQQTQGEAEQLQQVTSRYTVLVLLLLLPIAIPLTILSNGVVIVILGEKWLEAGPLLSALIIIGLSMSLANVYNAVLSALHKTKLTFHVDWITTAIILTALYAATNANLLEFSWVRALLSLIALLGYLIAIRMALPIKLLPIAYDAIPALLAGIGMWFIVDLLNTQVVADTFIELCYVSLIGLLAYTIIFIGSLFVLPLNSTSSQFFKEKIKALITKSSKFIRHS